MFTSLRLARWSIALSEYNFTVEHVSGKDTIVPDVFNRNFEEEEEDINIIDVTPVHDATTELKRMTYHQETDHYIGPIMATLKGEIIENLVVRGIRRIISLQIRKWNCMETHVWYMESVCSAERSSGIVMADS